MNSTIDNLAISNMQPATSPLPCDSYHHYYHYQSSAQYLWLAYALHILDRKEEAFKAYKNALFQDHFNEDALQCSDALEKGHAPTGPFPAYAKHPLSDAEFSVSVGMQPDEASHTHDVALPLYAAGRYETAISFLPASTMHSNSLFLIGKCQFRLGRHENAIRSFAEAIRISHKHHDQYHRDASHQHLLRGQKFMEEGHTDLAIADFTKALDLHRGNKEAQRARACAYAAKGNLRMAEADGYKAAGT